MEEFGYTGQTCPSVQAVAFGLIQQSFPSLPHDNDHLMQLLKIDIARSTDSGFSVQGLMILLSEQFGKHRFKGSAGRSFIAELLGCPFSLYNTYQYNSLPLGRTLVFMVGLCHTHVPGHRGGWAVPVRFSPCKLQLAFRGSHSVSRTAMWNLESIGQLYSAMQIKKLLKWSLGRQKNETQFSSWLVVA